MEEFQPDEKKLCSHCKQLVACSNFALHEVHCQRFLRPCARCGERVHKNNLQQHEDEVHALSTCNYCHKGVQRSELEEHKEACAQRPKICEFCEVDYPSESLPEHQSHCGSRTDPCPVCKKHIMKKSKAAHEAEGCCEPEPEMPHPTTEESRDTGSGTGSFLPVVQRERIVDDAAFGVDSADDDLLFALTQLNDGLQPVEPPRYIPSYISDEEELDSFDPDLPDFADSSDSDNDQQMQLAMQRSRLQSLPASEEALDASKLEVRAPKVLHLTAGLRWIKPEVPVSQPVQPEVNTVRDSTPLRLNIGLQEDSDDEALQQAVRLSQLQISESAQASDVSKPKVNAPEVLISTPVVRVPKQEVNTFKTKTEPEVNKILNPAPLRPNIGIFEDSDDDDEMRLALEVSRLQSLSSVKQSAPGAPQPEVLESESSARPKVNNCFGVATRPSLRPEEVSVPVFRPEPVSRTPPKAQQSGPRGETNTAALRPLRGYGGMDGNSSSPLYPGRATKPEVASALDRVETEQRSSPLQNNGVRACQRAPQQASVRPEPKNTNENKLRHTPMENPRFNALPVLGNESNDEEDTELKLALAVSLADHEEALQASRGNQPQARHQPRDITSPTACSLDPTSATVGDLFETAATIPCDFCNEQFPLDCIVQHQDACERKQRSNMERIRRNLNRPAPRGDLFPMRQPVTFKENIASRKHPPRLLNNTQHLDGGVAPRLPPVAQSEPDIAASRADENKIPCEFCQRSFNVEDLMPHQAQCLHAY